MFMTAPLKSLEGTGIAAAMADIGRRAKSAARTLALSPTAQRDKALGAMAQAIRDNQAAILAANAEDVAEAKASGATSAFPFTAVLTGASVVTGFTATFTFTGILSSAAMFCRGGFLALLTRLSGIIRISLARHQRG